jgi:hypothetical protein
MGKSCFEIVAFLLGEVSESAEEPLQAVPEGSLGCQGCTDYCQLRLGDEAQHLEKEISPIFTRRGETGAFHLK